MLFYIINLRKTAKDIYYFTIILFGLVIFRLPSFMQYSYNPDESEFLSTINLLSNNLSYWTITDTHTSGPLDSIPFVLFSILGIKWNYFIFRFINVTFIQFPTVIFTYYTIRFFFDNITSKTIILPIIFFYTFLSTNELIMYSSEQIPNLLLSISIYFLADFFLNKEKNSKAIIGVIALGLIPYAKFQYILLTGFIFFIFLTIVFKDKNWKLLPYVLIAFFIPTISIIVLLVCNKSFNDAFISYISMNFLIARNGLGYRVPFPDSMLNIFHLLRINIEFKILFISTILQFIYSVITSKQKILNALFFCSFAFLSVGYLTISKTGNLFYHYLFILICPFVVVQGYLFYLNSGNYKIFCRLHNMLYVSLFIYANFQNKYFIDDIYSKINNDYHTVSKKINSLHRSNHLISVWGWNTKLYIETNSFQSTRDPHTFNQIYNSKYKLYFLNRYLNDIKKNKPFVFVDAVPGFFFNDVKFRHENYTTINAYISMHYLLSDEINGTRIYTLKEAK